MTQPANSPANSNQNDQETILKDFKTTYCTEGSGILDAWIATKGDMVAIVYQLDVATYQSDLDTLFKLANKIPGNFRGLMTIRSLFPRETK